jgi:hypothetical protein
LKYFRNIYPQTRNCSLVYGGDQSRKQDNIHTISWNTLSTLVVE